MIQFFYQIEISALGTKIKLLWYVTNAGYLHVLSEMCKEIVYPFTKPVE